MQQGKVSASLPFIINFSSAAKLCQRLNFRGARRMYPSRQAVFFGRGGRGTENFCWWIFLLAHFPYLPPAVFTTASPRHFFLLCPEARQDAGHCTAVFSLSLSFRRFINTASGRWQDCLLLNFYIYVYIYSLQTTRDAPAVLDRVLAPEQRFNRSMRQLSDQNLF